MARRFNIPKEVWASGVKFGDFLVTADLGQYNSGRAEDLLSGNPTKSFEGIPTVSDWGMVAMVLMVLAAGSVLCRRHPAQC